MSTISTLNEGLAGIQNGQSLAKEAASSIASKEKATEGHPSSYAEPIVDLIRAENQVEASAKVVKAADETMGTIIDVLA